MSGIGHRSNALSGAEGLARTTDELALIGDAALTWIARGVAASAMEGVVEAEAERTARARVARAGRRRLALATFASATRRARHVAAAAVHRIHAGIDAARSAHEERQVAAERAVRVDTRADRTVGVANAAATDGARRTGGPSSAIDVGLSAVATLIPAGRSGAALREAHRALAVCLADASAIGRAPGARNATAVDVGLGAIAHSVAARAAHAHATRTDRGLAVRAREAGAHQRAGTARAAAIDVALVSVAKSVGARAVLHGHARGARQDGEEDQQLPHVSTPLQLLIIGQPSGMLVGWRTVPLSSQRQLRTPSHASQPWQVIRYEPMGGIPQQRAKTQLSPAEHWRPHVPQFIESMPSSASHPFIGIRSQSSKPGWHAPRAQVLFTHAREALSRFGQEVMQSPQ